jgi:hypothetical protein
MEKDLCFNLCYRVACINPFSHIVTRNAKISLAPVISKNGYELRPLFCEHSFARFERKYEASSESKDTSRLGR